MFRNVCVLVLIVLCGQAASAVSIKDYLGLFGKLLSQLARAIRICWKKRSSADTVKNLTPENMGDSGRCMTACMLPIFGIMKNDGSINADEVAKAIPEIMPMGDEFKQVLKHCNSSKGGDKCNSAKTWLRCMVTNGPIKKIIRAIVRFFFSNREISAALRAVVSATNTTTSLMRFLTRYLQ